MRQTLLALAVAALAVGGWGQQPSATNATDATGAEMVVTVLGRSGGVAPAIAPSQVSLKLGGDRDPVTGWGPFEGADSRIDLCLALDEDTRNLGNRLDDIRGFIEKLPPNVAVAVVYLATGTVQFAQTLTVDHGLAVKALRMPSGAPNVSPSPYGSLSALLEKWPRHADRRRELIVFSDGQEHIGGNNANNTWVQQTVGQAVAGGVVVYTLFVTGAAEQLAANTVANKDGSTTSSEFGGPLGGAGGRGMGALGNFGTAATNTAAGTINLSILAESTGGQAYSQGNGTPERFTPFLNDITARLQSQYRLSFTPPSKATGLVGVKVEVKNAGKATITAPKQFYIARP